MDGSLSSVRGSVEDRHKPSKQIRFKTSMLRSDLCNYSDIGKGDITLTKNVNRNFIDIRSRFLAFKNNGRFFYIPKIIMC